jgi:hypothetical protein
MNNKQQITIGAVFVVALFLVVFFWARRDMKSFGPPFENSQQIVAEINRLPVIQSDNSDSSRESWLAYESVAKRLKATDNEITLRAFAEMSPSNRRNSLSIQQKVMLLLRVSFECPAGSQAPYQGGWVYDALQVEGRTNFDANWPVLPSFSGFILQSDIDGYVGPPYEPVEEFKWRIANCRWRD